MKEPKNNRRKTEKKTRKKNRLDNFRIRNNKILKVGKLKYDFKLQQIGGVNKAEEARQRLESKYEAKLQEEFPKLFRDFETENTKFGEFIDLLNKKRSCEDETKLAASKEYAIDCFMGNPDLKSQFETTEELDGMLFLEMRSIKTRMALFFLDIPRKDFSLRHLKDLPSRFQDPIALPHENPKMIYQLVQVLIDRLKVIQNIMDLNKMISILEKIVVATKPVAEEAVSARKKPEAVRSSGRSKRKEEGFGIGNLNYFKGKLPNKINYIGTNYELVPDIRPAADMYLYNEQFLVKKERARDIFMIDYEYDSLSSSKVKKTKLPLYRSSGTSYSSSQKDLLSPFCGKSLQTIIYGSEPEKYDDCAFLQVLIFVASVLFKKEYTEKFGEAELPSGIKGVKLQYIIEEFEFIFIQGCVCSIWLIKFSPYIYHIGEGVIVNVINPKYEREKWPKSDALKEMLGGKYIEKQIRSSAIKLNHPEMVIQEYKTPLKIVENLMKTPTKEETSEMLNIFLNRYFANEDFFSMRNMGDFRYTETELSNYELNSSIKDQNIFDKDLSKCGQLKGEKNLEIKIMSYFYECFYYYKYDMDANSVFADIKIVLHIYDETEINIDVKEDTKYNYIFPNLDILRNIVIKLKKIGDDILSDPTSEESYKYKDTIFYNVMVLPFYDDITEPDTRCI